MSRMMFRRAALALILCLCAPMALAAAPTTQQIDRLLDLTRVRQTVEAMWPQLEASQRQMIEQMLAGRTLDDQQRALVQRVATRGIEVTRKALAWENLAPLYRDIYGQTFTAEDMDVMIEFYSSKAGQRLLDKMPQLMQNTMVAMQKIMVPLMQELQTEIARELPTPPAPPAPPAL